MNTRVYRWGHVNRKEVISTPTKTFLSGNSRICPEILGLAAIFAKLHFEDNDKYLIFNESRFL